MDDLFLAECEAVLAHTPHALDSLLRGLPGTWTEANEGPGTWSPFIVVGHLIHGERTDWIPRLEIILAHGESQPFPTFDREAQFLESEGKSLAQLLDEFSLLRQQSLGRLRALQLGPEQLTLRGTHPAFGSVTLRQLLATWTAHDLAHIGQITRVMARRLRIEVGPWAEYLSVMR